MRRDPRGSARERYSAHAPAEALGRDGVRFRRLRRFLLRARARLRFRPAWNFGNCRLHHWMLAMYEERAQEEVWGADPEALIASGIAFPQGAREESRGRLRHRRKVEFLELLETSRMGHARGHGARRRSPGRLPHVPAAQVAVRGHRRLARCSGCARRAALPWSPGRSSFRVQGARHAGGARRRQISRREVEPQPGLPRAALGAPAGTESRNARSANAQGALELTIAP